MIAIDTNILVYAHREDSQWHQAASERIKTLLESGLDWAIPWPCIHEFLAVVSHPGIYKPATPTVLAIDQVDSWLESPTLRLIGEGQQYWERLKQTITTAKIQGGGIHDARIASICLDAGVSKLWTADRDFSRLAPLKVENPLIGHGRTKHTMR
ncbi:MAG: PIN domain-containing protein [Deltaproteobacteria bacterium]|nr:PIN domain-containing protein [Deltaproteobacteria bacterium]MBI3294678.1 PIN domain-containing protein [Deltaproteobacteria bacterium]